MATEYRLTYFNARGRGEVTRMLFKLAGKEFIDRRVERGAEWDALKPTTPKGQLPVLEVDGKMICEGIAISRHVAREFNLYGANNWEATTCDIVTETLLAVYPPLMEFIIKAKTEDEKAEAMKKIMAAVEESEKFIATLKKGKFILGDNASIADVSIHNIMEVCGFLPGFNGDSCKTLNEVAKNFSEIPAIAEWIKIRPETSL